MKRFPFLDKALERLKPFLSDEHVSEISVNRPGELFIERLGVGGMERITDGQFSTEWILTLSERVAGVTSTNRNRAARSSASAVDARIARSSRARTGCLVAGGKRSIRSAPTARISRSSRS